MAEQLALLPNYLTSHLQLSLAALLLGVAISVPLGVLVTRNRRLEPGVLGVASVLQTIPSLALLALMVPLLAGLGVLLSQFGVEVRSIGFLPAVVALTLYSVLPILRNTGAGIGGVDAAFGEAALEPAFEIGALFGASYTLLRTVAHPAMISPYLAETVPQDVALPL